MNYKPWGRIVGPFVLLLKKMAENGFEVAVTSLGTYATVTFGTINFVAKCF